MVSEQDNIVLLPKGILSTPIVDIIKANRSIWFQDLSDSFDISVSLDILVSGVWNPILSIVEANDVCTCINDYNLKKKTKGMKRIFKYISHF